MSDVAGNSTKSDDVTATLSNEADVYGALCIIGCNGSLPTGDKRRKRSKFIFKKRKSPNGLKKGLTSIERTAQSSEAVKDTKLFSISYTVSEDKTVVVQYEHDEATDMFQIGRANDKIIDFVVLDKYLKEKGKIHQSTVSRYACRIVANRSDPNNVQLFAASFDSCRNIFLGLKAVKWTNNEDTFDALTTNGVLLSNPVGTFCGGNQESEASVWREVSVCGNILSVRGLRSSQEKGREIKNATNTLQDGSLIDLCGITLLWRSSEGLKKCVTTDYIEGLLEKCSYDGANSLVIPRKNTCEESEGGHDHQPVVNFNCGHVYSEVTSSSSCPFCKTSGPSQQLCMGMECAFYVDDITDPNPPKLFAFNPCGHIATEKTVKYWSKAPLPHGTCAYQAVCPFCASELQGYPGYVCLKFNDFSCKTVNSK